MGIRVPLVLDPLPKYLPDGTFNTQRYFDGYMMAAANRDWGSDPRTFIYDREGKIVAMFRSESPTGGDPVLAKLKELIRATSP